MARDKQEIMSLKNSLTLYQNQNQDPNSTFNNVGFTRAVQSQAMNPLMNSHTGLVTSPKPDDSSLQTPHMIGTNSRDPERG